MKSIQGYKIFGLNNDSNLSTQHIRKIKRIFVFAPNSTHRKAVTGYDKSKVEKSSVATINPNHRYRMSWAERLKRVFNIDITLCQHCQGNVRIVSYINDKTVIDKILDHIDKRDKDLKEDFNIFSIRGPPELVSLITSNITANYFKC